MKKCALTFVITLIVLSAQFGVQTYVKAMPDWTEIPLSGSYENRDIRVPDGLPLNFGELSLDGGVITGDGDIIIMSGSIRLESIRAAGGIYIAPGCEVYATGEIESGGVFECLGGTVSAERISAGRIWLDSSGSPLKVTVTGSVCAEYYTQCGGDVTIGGGLYCAMPSGGDGHAGITVNDEYARYGGTILGVAGDIVCAGADGAIEIGGGTAQGGLDEAALTAYYKLRSGKKWDDRTAYDYEPGIHGGEVTIEADSVTASRSLTVRSGSVTVRGTAAVLHDYGYISVQGGTLTELDAVSHANDAAETWIAYVMRLGIKMVLSD